MLLLLFHLGDEKYAIDSKQVAEIIPQVLLRKLYQAPKYVAGVFNYRGKIVPAIDLCHLIGGYPCRHCLSTRIIMVNYPMPDGTTRYVGLLAERVTDTMYKPKNEWIPTEVNSESTTYLGEMIPEKDGMIQRLRVEKLLSDSQRTWLLPENRS
ncbi:chemotaxis protein CheW [Crocosphaera sp. XPORK-15E]|uniref:chemotaxis protein CheW n=1 Tax=Crocosphaera sp. XPORK-15E TaxID=3110247 RepID=UPI002B21831D|nr:chemotaxis protein CheW [Crocosphaera sp. XPORK-15E]MEA5535717.1 chemotaxis protein CheW [Crocosphaera sp. XPORK-15E]